MDTDRWRCWGYTDHQCSDVGQLVGREMPITCISLFTCDQLSLDTADHMT
ncbi:unnamed protein product, partial [Staurois parvus]